MCVSELVAARTCLYICTVSSLASRPGKEQSGKAKHYSGTPTSSPWYTVCLLLTCVCVCKRAEVCVRGCPYRTHK